jgi:hypothetical protein
MAPARRPIAILANMEFDVRQLVEAGVLRRLAERHRVVLFLDRYLVPLMEPLVGDQADCRPRQYYRGSVVKGRPPLSRGRFFVHSLLTQVLKLTWGDQRPNATRAMLTQAYLGARRQSQLFSAPRLRRSVVALAGLASHHRWLRRGLLRFGEITLTPRGYDRFFREESPCLAVSFSLGISKDAFFMREARRHRVPVLSVVQSWDKTSTKGYPGASSDYAIVWSHVQAEEAQAYQDMRAERIYVGGVPEWDRHFLDAAKIDRASFCRDFSLAPERAVIFVALSSIPYHAGNLRLIEFLVDCLKRDRFARPAQLLLRVHPKYYRADPSRRERCELFGTLERLREEPNVGVDYPSFAADWGGLLTPEDQEKVRRILRHADVCLSVISTQMIEASIFDRPAVAVDYGQWKTNVLDVGRHQVSFEHLERIRRTGAVPHARSEPELLELVDEALLDPGRRTRERRALVDQEVPVHRGNAADKVAACIISVAEGRGLPAD